MSLGGGILHTGGYILYFVGAEGELRIEANASKRGQRPLVDYAEREHFRASEAWSIEKAAPLSLGEVVRSTREVCLRAERAERAERENIY